MTVLSAVNPKVIAEFVAKKVADITVSDPRFRKDIGNVQIDFVLINEGGREHAGIKFQFMTQDLLGIELILRVIDFHANPVKAMKEFFLNIHEMRYEALKRRANNAAEISQAIQAIQKSTKH
jgi:hypothetical protein